MDGPEKHILVDLDGTLCLDDHRVHHIRGGLKDWVKYFKACEDDLPNTPILELVAAMHLLGYRIHILSGRSDIVEDETRRWLVKHRVEYNSLRMRPGEDRTQDDILKIKWGHELGGPEKCLFVIEDRKRVVDAWRLLGYTVLQCAPGIF